MSPRRIASLPTPSPARLRAQRSPGGRARRRGSARGWRGRATARPEGLATRWSPTATLPESTVPVTTVPAPGSVKQRSTARRKGAPAGRALRSARGGLEAGAQGGHALAGDGGHGDDLGAFEAGAEQRVGDLVARGGEAVGVDEVGLGQGDEAAGQAEQVEDRQMLARLRHRRRRRRRRRAARSRCRWRRPACCARSARGRARRRSRGRAVGGRQVGEAEVDGDAARLLLLQPVGVDAGQRAHQRGLAVVDVAGGADDHGAGSGSGASAARRARPAASAVSAASAGRRNGSASALPPARARSSQARAATGSRGDAGAEMSRPRRASPGASASPRAAARAPPARRLGRVALDAERVVVDHAEPRHRARRRPVPRRRAPSAAPRPGRAG